ncbi:MAG: hypothetical protein N2235_06505 [Fischerella sp.]|nr:hypothetical protein [Fischerella sp.]
MLIKNSFLLLLAFASAFFVRVLTSVGIPSLINFAHFILIPAVAVYMVVQTRTKIRVYAVLDLLAGLMIMLAVVIASAMLNKAGIINIFIDYLLRAEWLIFLLAIISVTPSEKSLTTLRYSLLSFAFINLLFAYVQKFILRWGEGMPASGDYITGVFVGQGAGCDVSSGVSVIFAIYYFFNSNGRKTNLWIKIAVVLAAIIHLFITDAKSSFIIFLVSLAILMLTKIKLNSKSITLLIQYALILIVFLGILYWAAHTVAPGLLGFSDPSQRQDGFDLKFSVFSIFPSFYKSALNRLLGLGPGHTVGRLGGWMLRDYADLLEPLGATTHPASQAVWDEVRSTWIGERSRLWSPFFGWAGIWGDWGLLGVASYLYLLFIVWRRFCINDASKWILLSIPIFACIFTQTEEPGYVLSVAAILGLQWQEYQMEQQKIRRSHLQNLHLSPNLHKLPELN